jgi:hypothetical protein
MVGCGDEVVGKYSFMIMQLSM